MMDTPKYNYRVGKEVLLLIAERCDLKTVSTMMQTCKVGESPSRYMARSDSMALVF